MHHSMSLEFHMTTVGAMLVWSAYWGIWYYNLGCNVEAYMLSLAPHWETEPWCCDVGASASSVRKIDGAHLSCKQCRVLFPETTEFGVMFESMERFRVANSAEF